MPLNLKRSLSLLAVISALLCLSGCGDTARSDAATETAKPVATPAATPAPRKPMQSDPARLDPRAQQEAERVAATAELSQAGAEPMAATQPPARQPEGEMQAAPTPARTAEGDVLAMAPGAEPLAEAEPIDWSKAWEGATVSPGNVTAFETTIPQRETTAAPAPLDRPEPVEAARVEPVEPSVTALASPVRLADYSGRNPFPDEGEFITTPRPARKVGEAAAPPSGPLKVVPWDEAHRHVGETIVVEGEIVNTYNHNDSIVFLNFDNDWQDKFYIPVFDDAFPGIPGPAETFYKNKTLRITGKVTVHKGRPNIEVKDPAQIKVVR